MLFVCYPKCSTCQKAKTWLQERGVAFDERDIKQDNPTEQELRAWHEKIHRRNHYDGCDV